MSMARYLRFASVVIVAALLTSVEGLAQLQRLAEIGRAADNQQLLLSDRSGEIPLPAGTPASAGAPVVVAVSKPTGESLVVSPNIAPPPDALFLPSADRLSPLEQTYLDAFTILRGDNSCSRFFGGARVIEVLNELKKQLRPGYTESGIAVKMSGETISYTSFNYGFSYRLFAKAELNLKGAFYSANTFHSGASVPSVGRFSPNTREARVTILLHELGHLVETADKQWLLPNDGKDPSLSIRNTQQIIRVCGEQIEELSSTSFESELQMARVAASDHALQASVQ